MALCAQRPVTCRWKPLYISYFTDLYPSNITTILRLDAATWHNQENNTLLTFDRNIAGAFPFSIWLAIYFQQTCLRDQQLALILEQPTLVLVCFNMEKLKSLPTTRATGPHPAMWLSLTQRGWLEMQPKTRLPWTPPTQCLVNMQNYWQFLCLNVLISIKASTPIKLSVYCKTFVHEWSDLKGKLIKITRYCILSCVTGVTVVVSLVVFSKGYWRMCQKFFLMCKWPYPTHTVAFLKKQNKKNTLFVSRC